MNIFNLFKPKKEPNQEVVDALVLLVIQCLDPKDENVKSTFKDFFSKCTNEQENKFCIEWVIFHAFIMMNACLSRNLPHEIIDYISSKIYHKTKDKFNLPSSDQYERILQQRYIEYREALRDKREPNPLWWLGKAVAKNLIGEKTEYLIEGIGIAGTYTYTAKSIVGFIDDCRKKGLLDI